MQFSNCFEVALPPEKAWPFLLDIERIAPCMPGAELTDVIDNKTYKGKVSVRLGPVALSFVGTAKLEGVDDNAHTARVKAKGIDSKGRGGASATVDFRLEPGGSGTKVLIDTDLNLSGSVAQYGRGSGMIQSVASQLIGQFAKSLADEIGASRRTDVSVGQVDPEMPNSALPHHQATSAPPQARSPKPIGGFGLIFNALWSSLLGLLRRDGSNRTSG